MKKSVLLGSLVVIALTVLCCVVMTGMTVFAEEIEQPAQCTVSYEIVGYGDVACDIEEGNIGDVATISVKPYVFCKLVGIKVNGVDLIPSEDGSYSFALVEGANNVTASFAFDEEQMGALTQYANQAQEEGLASLFTMKNLMTLVSWAISLLMGSGFLLTWLKTKTIKSATSESVKKDCIDASNETIATSLECFLTTKMIPMINSISDKLANTDEICQTLARCMVLAQENTPEARLAIIEELTKLKTSSKELAESIKSLIAVEVAKNEEEKNATQTAIQEMEETNNNLEEEIKVEPIKEEVKPVVQNY